MHRAWRWRLTLNPLLAFAAGILLGVGLLLTGLADPLLMQGFLDVAGLWNPSPILAIAAALGITWPAFVVARRRNRSRSAAASDRPRADASPSLLPTPTPTAAPTPSRSRIDGRLIVGALIYGAGWGLVGICPTSGLVLVGMGRIEGLVFLGAMVLGMAAVEVGARFMRPAGSAAQN